MPIKPCDNCRHRATSHKRRRSEGGYARFECKECREQDDYCGEYEDPAFGEYMKQKYGKR